MPSVTLSDELSETGTIAVSVGSTVGISGSHVAIDVLTETTQVVIEATNFFFRIKIEWNGGTTPATVLDWTNQDIIENPYVAAYGDPNTWMIVYDNVNSNVRSDLTLGPTPGNTLQQIEYVTFAYGSPTASTTSIVFVTKNGSGVPINPADGDVCWIEIRPAAL